MSILIMALLVAAGAALVAQNLLMAHMTATVSTVLITLVMNAAVGLVALLVLLVGRSGLVGINEAVGAFRVWSVVPGLLGSFFVFASIVGYQRLGAASTISILVASQMVIGLAVDIARDKAAEMPSYFPTALGCGFLIMGALLVASRNP